MRRKDGYSIHPLAHPKGSLGPRVWMRTQRFITKSGLESFEVQYVDRRTQEILLEFRIVHNNDYSRLDVDGNLLPLQWRVMENGDIRDQPKLKR